MITTNFSYVNLSALLVSNVSSFVAAFYIFKLVKLDYDDNAAVKAVLYFCIFPTAFFLSVIYAEGLFLALTIASFYYDRMGKWRSAGLLSLFSALTRIGGLILLPALLIEYFHQKKWRLRKIDFNVFWLSLCLVGFLIYIFINYQITGNPFTFMAIETIKWHQSINPLLGFQRALQWTFTGTFPIKVQAAGQLVFAGLGLFAIVLGFRLHLRPSYNMYMAFSWLLIVSTSWWMSIPRFVLTMFPLFIIMGFSIPSRKTNFIIALLSLGVMWAFTIFFAFGYFVF